MQMLRKILDDLEFCIQHQTYTPIETENIELKDFYFSLLRELKIVENATLQDLSIDALNDYIYEINKEIKLETPKTDIETAKSFLERKKFIIDNQVTTLGMLVCGKAPEYFLEARCQVDCFVDSALEVVADKKILKDNVLALMTKTMQFVMKNIQVGISPKNGGQVVAEYPEKLLQESINNALAHRDYSQNKNTTVVIKPNQSIEIRNAGVFKKNVLIEHHKHEIPVLRIIPDVKRTNPLLADILRSYNQYEGRGTGISTIINDCLDNKIGLPYYKFHTENEMTLVITKGKLLDTGIETLLKNYEGFIQKLTKYGDFGENHKLVLAYLIKSERENQKYRYTILLTADNNHLQAIGQLQAWNLIFAHPLSEQNKPIFLVHRQLLQIDFTDNLIEIFGEDYQNLPIIHKNCLQIIYQYENFAVEKIGTASQLANILFAKQHPIIEQTQLQELDVFKRKVRSAVLLLQKKGFLEKKEKSLVICKGNFLTF